MRGKLFFVIVILALLLSGFAPAQTTPTPVKLAFNNKTTERVSITMDGPAKYTFSLPPGKSRQMALPGRYRYAYTACEVQKRGGFDLKTSGGSFVIDKCPRKPVTPPDTYELVLDNKTGETVMFHLEGPENYVFNLKPGKSNHKVKPGKYYIRFQACEIEDRDSILVRKDGALYTLVPCSKYIRINNNNLKHNIVSVKIKNDTGARLSLKLVGPETYNLLLPAGNSSIDVQRANYNYTITGCGGTTITGIKRLGPHMVWRFKCEG